MGTAPLLLDIGCLCDAHSDAALELIHKAMGEDPPADDIWAPHPNPYIRQLVELFTQRGLDRTAGLADEFRRWLQGAESEADTVRPPRPAGAMERWSKAEVGLARAYLKALPSAEWTLDDWLMLVDYLAQRYLPADDLRSEADWLATRSNMMGRVQSAIGETTTAHVANIAANLPSSEEAALRWGLTPHQRAVIDFGRARAAENIVGLADAARRRMRKLIVDYREAEFLGQRSETSESLQTKLLDEFGTQNRDWRRIAVTEATENANQGFVAASAAGDKIKRVEKYRGACAFCRAIDGRVVEVVDPAKPAKDGDLEVWVGKTNIGRSSSPRKREAGALVEREPHERMWLAAGAQHPHCRGSWVRVGGASRDPEFEAWLSELKGRK